MAGDETPGGRPTSRSAREQGPALTPPIVEVRGLRYSREDGTGVLNGLDFDLDQGGTVALLGPNGSGRTTFALHLNGMLRGAGTILVDGLEMNDINLSDIRQRVGLVFEDSGDQLLMPTVLEDVAFGLVAAGVDREEAIARAYGALNKVSMAHKADKSPRHLSAGEKKRVAIAGVLASEPKLLVLDEPATFLDPCGQRELATLLASLPQAKILITNQVSFARRLTGDAAFFSGGTVIARGPIAGIAQQFDW